jgi:hypothetical protein
MMHVNDDGRMAAGAPRRRLQRAVGDRLIGSARSGD